MLQNFLSLSSHLSVYHAINSALFEIKDGEYANSTVCNAHIKRVQSFEKNFQKKLKKIAATDHFFSGVYPCRCNVYRT